MNDELRLAKLAHLGARFAVVLALIIACFVMTVGCTEIRYKEVCEYTDESIEKSSDFIIECSGAANPMSDEEGEDLVQQCEVTSRMLLKKAKCTNVPQFNTNNNGWFDCSLVPRGSWAEKECAKL